MASTYVITPLAESDLEAIWLYAARKWSRGQAETYTNNILDACDDLANGKMASRPVPIRDGYFKASVARHFIYFRRGAETLLVVRILHQRMDVELHL